MYHGIFINVIYVLIFFLCILFLIILGYVLYKNKISSERERWQPYITYVISKAIFDQPTDEVMSRNVKRLSKNVHFRNCLLHELIQTKKNLAGNAGSILKELYESFGLNVDSAAKLKSMRWHIKAKGIQELAIMEQAAYVKYIFRLTNNRNELVRNEAQCGLVNFYGFRGLRFLNVMVHSLSQWQQIQLLNKLNGAVPEDISSISKWLKSDNQSVVIFSLKLAKHYNCMEVYDEVVGCLKMPGHEVRVQVINYLKALPTPETADIILKDYELQSKETRLFILASLKEIGNENQVPFLISQLHDADDEIINETLDTLLVLNPPGSFQSSFINRDSNKALVHVFNNEHAA